MFLIYGLLNMVTSGTIFSNGNVLWLVIAGVGFIAVILGAATTRKVREIKFKPEFSAEGQKKIEQAILKMETHQASAGLPSSGPEGFDPQSLSKAESLLQSHESLDVILGSSLGAFESAGDEQLRASMARKIVSTPSTVGVLTPQVLSHVVGHLPDTYRTLSPIKEKGRRFLEAIWPNLKKEACDWLRENAGKNVDQALIANLASSLIPKLPDPWNRYRSGVILVISVIIIKAGADTVCDPMKPAPS
jgi:hypothetical protein